MYQLLTHIDQLKWEPLEIKGVSIKPLHKDENTGAMSVITKMEAGAVIPKHRHTSADETVYILNGDFIEDGKTFEQGGVFYGKAQTDHGPHSTLNGCLLLTHFSAKLDFVMD